MMFYLVLRRKAVLYENLKIISYYLWSDFYLSNLLSHAFGMYTIQSTETAKTLSYSCPYVQCPSVLNTHRFRL